MYKGERNMLCTFLKQLQQFGTFLALYSFVTKSG